MNEISFIKSSDRGDCSAHSARMQHIRELVPLLQAEADESERLTHLTDKASNAMRDAGLFHLLMPRELGGAQVSFVEAIEATELIAWADGAAGWYILVGNVISASMGAYLPDAGAAEIYGSRPYTMSAGQGVPSITQITRIVAVFLWKMARWCSTQMVRQKRLSLTSPCPKSN
jgi:Acyl-CoA dehydrogenase, N-terminal domain